MGDIRLGTCIRREAFPQEQQMKGGNTEKELDANLLTIVVLSRGRCELSNCITRYLIAMAAADLSVLIFEVLLYEIKDAYFPYSFLNYTPVCSLNLALLFASVDCSVWLTVAITFDRFVAICCQKLRRSYCNTKTASVTIGFVCTLSVLESIPIYFVYEPREIIDNLPWSCYVKASFYALPVWSAFLWLESVLTPFAPFLLILLFNILTIRCILQANRLRKRLRGNNDSENDGDTEKENRRKSIFLLLAVSGSFILLWSVTFISNICVQFTDATFLEANYNDFFTILEQTGYILRTLSCCTNTFIYAISQRKFREEFKSIIKPPFESNSALSFTI
ncbi:probable G-protein coupled receptor 139 [Stegostoma tigrinum]|uniref:probable G-protein coupled receptor 139 n=1 Tax=Stegostoma tigrinum TaxID=3053191 RepID=UPI00287078A6|nr:probable G-protein coupled receptor 139 [Stegostoma tigrinum]